MLKYFCVGGYVYSADGDRHWIAAHRLPELYRVDPKLCVCSDSGYVFGLDSRGLILLEPRSDGQYIVPVGLALPRALQGIAPIACTRAQPVTLEGKTFFVTPHARRRYYERVGRATDEAIVLACLDDPRAVWNGEYLVTYLAAPKRIWVEDYGPEELDEYEWAGAGGIF